MCKSFLFLLIMVAIGFSQPYDSTFTTRRAEMAFPTAQQPPFMHVENWDTSMVAWACKSKVYIFHVEIKDYGTLRVVTRGLDTVNLYCTNYDIKPVDIIRILKSGTTANNVTLMGYDK